MGEALFTITISNQLAGYGGDTVRGLIPAVFFEKCASRIKVKFTAGANDLNLTKVYIGHKASSGDQYDFDGNQVQLLFSAGATLDLTAGNSQYSDEIDFDLDSTKPIVISALIKSGGSGYLPYSSSSVATINYKSVDDAATTDASSYSASSTAGSLLVSEIYAVTVGDSDASGTSIFKADSQAIGFYDTGNNGYTARFIIPAAKLSTSGSSIKVLFSAGVGNGSSNEGLSIAKAYIGHKALSGDVYDFDGDQVQLLFGAAANFQIGPGEQIWSDEATFSLDSEKDIVVSLYYSDSSNDSTPCFPVTGAAGYYKYGDDAATTDASGYTAYANWSNRVLGVYQIVVPSAALEDLSTNVSSSITITDVVTIEGLEIPLAISDATEVSENVSVTCEEAAVLSIDVVGTVTVAGAVVASVQDPDVSIIDTISVSEEVSCTVEEIDAVADASIDIYDEVTIDEAVLAAASDLPVSVVDSAELSEASTIELSTFEVSVVDSTELSEDVSLALSDIGVEASESISVQESVAAALGDLELSVTETSSLSDVTISEVSTPSIEVVDEVTIVEDYDVVPEVTGDVVAQDSVSVGDVPDAAVSSPEPSCFDTVTLAEQVAIAIELWVAAVDDITVAESVETDPPVLNVSAVDAVSVSEDIGFVRDHVASTDDNIAVSDEVSAEVSDLVGSTYDEVGVVDAVTVEVSVAADFNVSVEDGVSIAESSDAVGGGLEISVSDDIHKTEYVSAFWEIAQGIVILDVDVIVPIVDTELRYPEMPVSVIQPTLDLEVA